MFSKLSQVELLKKLLLKMHAEDRLWDRKSLGITGDAKKKEAMVRIGSALMGCIVAH